MAISCVIGLAVCLNFAGERFHADELIEAFDTCEMVRQLSPDQFDGSSGYGIENPRVGGSIPSPATTNQALSHFCIIAWDNAGTVTATRDSTWQPSSNVKPPTARATKSR